MGRQALLSPLLLAHAARGHWDVGERRDGLEVRARARVASDARQRRGHARARATILVAKAGCGCSTRLQPPPARRAARPALTGHYALTFAHAAPRAARARPRAGVAPPAPQALRHVRVGLPRAARRAGIRRGRVGAVDGRAARRHVDAADGVHRGEEPGRSSVRETKNVNQTAKRDNAKKNPTHGTHGSSATRERITVCIIGLQRTQRAETILILIACISASGSGPSLQVQLCTRLRSPPPSPASRMWCRVLTRRPRRRAAAAA